MRNLLLILTTLLCLLTTAHAAEPPTPADPALVAELLPGYTLVEGIDGPGSVATGNELRLLMRRPDGVLVFVGAVKSGDSWLLTESSPLPEGTMLGVENFTHSLGIPVQDGFCHIVSLSPWCNGTWGVSLMIPDSGEGLFQLGIRWISDGTSPISGCFGDHPWSDVTAIDWSDLPTSYEEAAAALDNDDWAMVSNPDPADRLHLRVAPDRSSRSICKFWNGTPVRVVEYGEDWCQVELLGIPGLGGYMMTRYLAFGEAVEAVDYAAPWLMLSQESAPMYFTPSRSVHPKEYLPDSERLHVLGVIEDKWYFVWLPDASWGTALYCYLPADALTPGNG